MANERQRHVHVYCGICGALGMKVLIADDGTAPESYGDCGGCGASISLTEGRDGYLENGWADDGEREETCGVDWPEWAIEAYERWRESQ